MRLTYVLLIPLLLSIPAYSDEADNGTNYALGKPVTGQNFPTYNLHLITNGDRYDYVQSLGNREDAIATVYDIDLPPDVFIYELYWNVTLYLNADDPLCTVEVQSEGGSWVPIDYTTFGSGAYWEVTHTVNPPIRIKKARITGTPGNFFIPSINNIYLYHEVEAWGQVYLEEPEDNFFYGSDPYWGFSKDPVNTATGNFIHQSTDLSIGARGNPLKFARFYNSQSTVSGPLGPGWTHSYNIYLEVITPGQEVSVTFGDGRTLYWESDGMGGFKPKFPGLYDELVKNADDSWTLTRKNLDVYHFDKKKRLRSITDKNGNVVQLKYQHSTFPLLMTSLVGPAGREVSLNYSPGGLLEGITDFASPPRSVAYSYTGGRLTQVNDVSGNPIGYHYNTDGYLEQIVDQRGVTAVTNYYDVSGRVTEQRDGNNNATLFAYDTPNPDQTTLTRTVTVNGTPRTVETIHTHDALYKTLLSIEDPLGATMEFGYDGDLNRTSITDRNGKVAAFGYDGRGNILSAQDPDDPGDPNDGGVTTLEYNDPDFPDFPTKKTDPLGFVTEWTYDSSGNVMTEKHWLDLGQTQSVSMSWIHNSFGQPLTETDERGHDHFWNYDADGLLIQEIDREGNATWYGHDDLWRLTQFTDGRGSGPGDPAYATEFTCDNADRLLEVKAPPVGSPPHQITRSYQYDEIGNLTHSTDGRGNTTRYFHDGNSNFVRKEEPLDGNPQGRVTAYAYDELNRMVLMTDANLHDTTYTYDDANRLETVEDAAGNQWTYVHDANENLLTETDPSGVTTTYGYDALNRRTSMEDLPGTTWAYTYDQRGRMTRQKDPGNHETHYSYDALDRLVKVVDAEGGVTDYTFDETGNLVLIEDAAGHAVSTREYDGENRLTKAVDGVGNLYVYGYDAAENQTSVVDGNQAATSLVYDGANRLLQIDYPQAHQVQFAYDDDGNRIAITDPTGSSAFTYDELNRLRTSTDSYGMQVGYTYDPVGNRIALTYPDTKQVTYGYDAANRLTTITDWASRVTAYTYDGFRLKSTTFPNGILETRGYDVAGRLASLGAEDSGQATLWSLSWVRDGTGNPTSSTETGTLQPEFRDQSSETSAFDNDNRLLSAIRLLFGKARKGPPANDLRPGMTRYVYDGNGNMITRTQQGKSTSFLYDSEDRLTAQSGEGIAVQHTYDGLGNRIARTENGDAVRYVLDRGRSMSHVLCETDQGGTITAYYIHGPQVTARIGGDGSERYVHTNDTGNVIALTDDQEVITDRYAYTPFGLPYRHEGDTLTPFTFAGGLGVMEEPHGLYFMRARFYDARSGRFTGKDPLEGSRDHPMSLHRYLYALNNPLSVTDPDGRNPVAVDIFLAILQEIVERQEKKRWLEITEEEKAKLIEEMKDVLQQIALNRYIKKDLMKKVGVTMTPQEYLEAIEPLNESMELYRNKLRKLALRYYSQIDFQNSFENNPLKILKQHSQNRKAMDDMRKYFKKINRR